MIAIASVVLRATFSGLFLWSAPSSGDSIYCQLTQIGAGISGDCYATSVAPDSPAGVKHDHFVVRGEVDGERAQLRVQGLFGLSSTWGIATAYPDGFQLGIAMNGGITEVLFRRAADAEVNAVVAALARRGASARASYNAVQRTATEHAYLDRVRADMANTQEGLADIDRDLRQYVADSIRAGDEVIVQQNHTLLMEDSVARFGTSEEHPWLTQRLDDAREVLRGYRRNAVDYNRNLAEERTRRNSLVAQVNRDSQFIREHSR
jgi:hypothetical protein